MGVPLTPIVTSQTVTLESLAGRTLAIDGNAELYQFLALIRLPDGTPLMGSDGRVTSHLVGLFYRTTRLMGEYGVLPAFVFDGEPPPLKQAELARRRAIRQRYEVEATAARDAGDAARAYSKSTMTSRLTRDMVAEATELLTLLGVPVVQAPSEGEAQAASMARSGIVWAAASKDYDALLFGTPRLLRFLTLTGKEYLPSRNEFRPLTPELIDTTALLDSLGITHDQLVDLAILVGTDFNEGIHGIGPKKALKLVRTHGAIEQMPEDIRGKVPDAEAVRAIYRAPQVTTDVRLDMREPDEDGIVAMLSGTRRFAETRVRAALDRLRSGRERFDAAGGS